jgi:hypothetical protein
MLKSLFKQPYKVVRFQNVVFIPSGVLTGNYFPFNILEGEIQNVYSINQNTCVFPEEENVLVKKVHCNIYTYSGGHSGPAWVPVKNWVINYEFLNRTESKTLTYQTRNQNVSSGDWNTPSNQYGYLSSCNTAHPTNDFQNGIVAGGIYLKNFSALAYNLLGAEFTDIIISMAVYYQDLDEKK